MADGPDLQEIVRRTVQANARFYKGWMDLSVDYFRGISEIFGGVQTTPAAEEGFSTPAGVLVLEGEDGATVQGAFLVTNDLGRVVSCDLTASDFINPGGTNVKPNVTFEPAKFDLAPGEQRIVQVSVPIDSSFTAGYGYTGEFAIRGMDGFSVPVVLRRQHGPNEWVGDPHDESPIGTSGANPNESPIRKAAGKKTRPTKQKD